MQIKNILVTGATGQIGSELTLALRERFGAGHVYAAGHHRPALPELAESGPYCTLDVRDAEQVKHIVETHRIDTVFHLASLLSAVAEQQPQAAWDVNMNGLINILEAARQYRCSVFFPSSIAAFGPDAPPMNTPQDTIQRPSSLYGITKVSGELLCDYYHQRYGIDTRGVRYPGLISSKTPPGGGTTDYAVDIFYAATERRHYDCFLNAGTQLDMMYMPDAIEAAIGLMTTDEQRLRHRNAFNVTAMSFTPAQLAAEIQRHVPDFSIAYAIDPVRQAIADSWPKHIDDSTARAEWDWRPKYDLPAMVEAMLTQISSQPPRNMKLY